MTDKLQTLLKNSASLRVLGESTAEPTAIEEGFSLSAPTMDVMSRLYDEASRAMWQVGEAMNILKGVEPSSLSPDAARVIQNAVKHLSAAHAECYKATRTLVPDAEYSAYRDSTV